MKHPTRRGNNPFPLTDEEINYIKENYSKQSAPSMSLHLHRSPKRIYAYLYDNNLKPFGSRGWNPRDVDSESELFDADAVKGEHTWIV